MEDAEIGKTKSDLSYAKFEVLVKKWGSDKEYNVPFNAWGETAEVYADSLKKGTKVHVCGSYDPSTYKPPGFNSKPTTNHKFTAKDIRIIPENTTEPDIDLPF